MIVAALVSLGAAAGALPGHAGPLDGAEAVVRGMIADFDGLSGLTDLDDEALARRFDAIVDAHFDRRAMALAALGAADRRLTRDQRQAYIEAYARLQSRSYVSGVRQSGPSASTVLGGRIAPDGTAIVVTRIASNEREHDTLWYMCPGAANTVCDVEIDGIMVSTHLRADFADRLRVEGIDGLIRALETGAVAIPGPGGR